MKDENIKIKTEMMNVKRHLAVRERDATVKSEKIKALEAALVEMRDKLGFAERRASDAESKGQADLRFSLGSTRCNSCGHRGGGQGTVSPETPPPPRHFPSPSPPRFDISPEPVESHPGFTSSKSLTYDHKDDEVDAISRQVAMDMACGFCEGIESVCVCRMVRENERKGGAAPFDTTATTTTTVSGDVMGIHPVTKQLTPTYQAELSAAVKSTSILDNLPPVEAAVPLRRRRERGGLSGIKKPPIFAVSPAAFQEQSPLYIPPAECSGDPRNCPACKDDDFGKSWNLLASQTLREAHS